MVLPGDGIVRGMVYSGSSTTRGGTPRGQYCKGDGILGSSTTREWYSQGMVL